VETSKFEMKSKISIYAIGFILIAALSRLLPHPPNFTPIGAMALLGGTFIAKKYLKYLLPIAALFLSDVILNNTIMRVWYPDTEGFILFNKNMIWVYAAFLIMIFFGSKILKQRSFKNIAIGTLGVSIIFFLITNLGVWVGSTMYPDTVGGLLACFSAALPFFLNTLLGNIFFVTLGFSAMQWLESRSEVSLT